VTVALAKAAGVRDRERLRRALVEAIAAGTLTDDEAADLLAAYDAGTLALADLPAEAREAFTENPSAAALAALAAAALVVLATVRPSRTGPPVRWRYDAGAGRYLPPSGVPVHPVWSRRELDRALVSAGEGIARTAAAPVRRDVVRLDWLRDMEAHILERHAAAAALARGGLARLTAEDREWLRARVLAQYDFLDGFEAAIRAGEAAGEPMTEAAIVQRAAMYNDAARATYEAMRGRTERDLGRTRERNLLGVADHCAECEQQTARGWVEIGALVPVGERSCLTRCKCVIRYA
jgi:hypothetical protein